MRSLTAHISLLLTGSVLLAGMWLLSTSRLEYCGRPMVLQPRSDAATVADAPAPTLAPPLKVVFVRVEADKSDLEVGWAENWQLPHR